MAVAPLFREATHALSGIEKTCDMNAEMAQTRRVIMLRDGRLESDGVAAAPRLLEVVAR